jgi:hypothetical protein
VPGLGFGVWGFGCGVEGLGLRVEGLGFGHTFDVHCVHLLHRRRLGVERQFFMDNLLVQIHLIIEMISVDRPCAMGV